MGAMMELAKIAEQIRLDNKLDLEKLSHKLSKNEFDSVVTVIKDVLTEELPLYDFGGKPLSIIRSLIGIPSSINKMLQTHHSDQYGLAAMTDEIQASLSIEKIDTSRESVQRILRGFAPTNDIETRVAGQKAGLDFIADPQNLITEENLYRLYMIAIGQFLPREHLLKEGSHYRDDAVYVISSLSTDPVHTGVDAEKISERMKDLFIFLNADHNYDHLIASIILHFYIAYLHPWFDGNGRMARLVQLWYLIQKGYSSALFVSFSKYLLESKARYYKAFRTVETNQTFLGQIDLTPFVLFFIQEVLNKLNPIVAPGSFEKYQAALSTGSITEKEKTLWQFVLTFYGSQEFSTKGLEKEFGNAAYATIYHFVRKFQKLGLLKEQPYGMRTKYRVA